jgi:hypothetical protein
MNAPRVRRILACSLLLSMANGDTALSVHESAWFWIGVPVLTTLGVMAGADSTILGVQQAIESARHRTRPDSESADERSA